MKKINVYRGLPKEVYIISIARFINSLGNFVFPFITFFLSDKLNMNEDKVGYFVMMSMVSYVPGSIIGGRLGDFFGRKITYVICQMLAGLCVFICGFLNYSHILPWLLILSGVFNGAARPLLTSMITDLVVYKERKRAFSLSYLAGNLGFAIGPVVAGLLYKNYTRLIFFGDGITTFLASTLIFVFIKETKPNKEDIHKINDILEKNEKEEKGLLITVLLKRPFLLIFSVIIAFQNFVYSQHSFTLNLQMQEIFGVEGAKLYGILMATNGIVVVVLTIIITNLTLNLPPLLSVSLCGIFFALGFGMLAYIKLFYLFIISTVIWTIGEIFSATNVDSYISKHTPINFRSRFNAIIPIISGTGYALGPYISGICLKNGSTINQIWILTFYISLISSILLYIQHKFEK
ncbi:MFS transporter [Tepidibacter formicigenes]|jgi:MFS family permease|uniref:Major Facilitator Superfamily protein n=1 Tax=Tepidibacter formicigenes DSM 15518 TaxID=1123349 RepID=A0A1M6JKF0_9FIRM|nr:MFS transporter [Tepidibacter formicigenes]SHJ47144.1 Major Facilitator Superfamily protein [Tepidibacter formicigenes DSM 15518]